MASEIEIKANVSDKDKLLSLLLEKAKFKKKYYKKDIYYKKNQIVFDINECVRLRKERGSYTFCAKTRNMTDGIEINDEREMPVTKTKAKTIIRFIEDVLCMKEFVVKEKKGRAFTYKNTLIEISSVKGLGDYVEIEITDESKVEGDKVFFLKSILREFDISENDIETAPYIVLLEKKYAKSKNKAIVKK